MAVNGPNKVKTSIGFPVMILQDRVTSGGHYMITSGEVSAWWPAPLLLTTSVMFRNVLAAAVTTQWQAKQSRQWSGVCLVTSSTDASDRCHVQECARCWRPLLRAPGRHIQPLHFQEKWEGRQKREERRGGIASHPSSGGGNFSDRTFLVPVCLCMCIIVGKIGLKSIVWILSPSL